MISSPKTPHPGADVGNVTARKVATNQRAIPLPFFGGRVELPLIWGQSRVYNVKTKAVTSKVGKSKQVTGYDYYGDLFGLTSCCLNDYLAGIELNGNMVWAGDIERGVDHPHHSGDIVVSGVGTFRYYWGTPDQPEDDLVLATCGEEHPHYPDQSFLVGREVYFGNNNSTPPTIRVVAERAARFAGLREDRSREGTNPVTLLAEMIGNDWFGLARPDVVDVATWAPMADAQVRSTPVPLEGAPDYTAAMGYISPLVDRVQACQSFIAQILENFDGWLRRKGEALEIGQFPHDGVIPEDLAEMSFHDFLAAPQFEDDDDSAGDIITDAIVIGPDRDNGMEDDSEPATNQAARNRIGETREKTFRRPFIITNYQRRELAGELVKFFSRAEEKCSVQIRRERVVGLRAGDRFILNDAPSSQRIVVRIAQRRDESVGGRVSLSLVAERGLAPLGYVPVPVPAPELPAPELVVIAQARIFQLPTLFADYAPAAAVVALAERPAAHVAGFTVHYATAGVTYDEIVTVGRWALRATLAAGITGADATFTVNAAGFELALLSAQSDAAKSDDALLLVCGYEVISIGDVTALGGGQYELDVLRGRRGSAAAVHAGAAECFIIRREDLTVLQHADFPRTTSNRYFKLASYTDKEIQELADALAITFLFDDTEVGDVGTFAATGKAEAIYVSWTLPLLPNGEPDPTIAMVELWERALGAAAPVDGDPWQIEVLATGINRGGLAAGTQRDYYARLRDTANNKGGIVGPVSATAQAAATGATGAVGPGLVYVGAYNAANAYYCTAARVDVVTSGGSYYRATNAAKSGLATWGAPGGGDWSAPDATFKFVATDLLLAQDVAILKTLTMGDGATANAGIIRSHAATAYLTGIGFWMGHVGTTPKFRVGDPAKSYIAYDGALSIVFGESTAQIVIDTDATFVGPNPPARLRLGSAFTLSASSAAVCSLTVSDGSMFFTKTNVFAVGSNFAWYDGSLGGAALNYGIDTLNAEARFNRVGISDGGVGDLAVRFRLDPDTGIYRFGSGDMRFVCDATTALVAQAGQVVCLVPLKLDNNFSAGAPAATGYVTVRDAAGATYKLLCAP